MSVVAKASSKARQQHLMSDFAKLSDATRSHLFAGDCMRATHALVGLARVRGEVYGAGIEISAIADDTFSSLHRQVFRQCIRSTAGVGQPTGKRRHRR